MRNFKTVTLKRRRLANATLLSRKQPRASKGMILILEGEAGLKAIQIQMAEELTEKQK